jgi:membrane protein
MKNNNVSLILSRISLAITSIYVFFILYLIISTTYRVNHGERDLQIGFGMMFGFLLPHLIALVITTILNIIISLKNSHTYPLIITTFILYIVTAFLGAAFVPFILIVVIIQIILLLIACITYKRNTNIDMNSMNNMNNMNNVHNTNYLNDTNSLYSNMNTGQVMNPDYIENTQSRKFIKNNNLAKISLIISIVWALYLIIPTLLSVDKNYYYNPYYFISLIIAILLNALVIQNNGNNLFFKIIVNVVAALYLFTFLQGLIAIFVIVLALTIIVNIYMNKPLPYEAGIIITIFSSLLYFITSILFGSIADIPYFTIVPLFPTSILALSLLAK